MFPEINTANPVHLEGETTILVDLDLKASNQRELVSSLTNQMEFALVGFQTCW